METRKLIKSAAIILMTIAVVIIFNPASCVGAISKDNQIIGVRLVVYWQYDEENIYVGRVKGGSG
jgi:regulator of protease activity HflC (stomatin/prohibitin superfamily)